MGCIDRGWAWWNCGIGRDVGAGVSTFSSPLNPTIRSKEVVSIVSGQIDADLAAYVGPASVTVAQKIGRGKGGDIALTGKPTSTGGAEIVSGKGKLDFQPRFVGRIGLGAGASGGLTARGEVSLRKAFGALWELFTVDERSDPEPVIHEQQKLHEPGEGNDRGIETTLLP